MDSLNEVSSALLELVPWRAREGLEKMVAEDNERYRLVSDTITQKVEEIDAALLRSQQVRGVWLVVLAINFPQFSEPSPEQRFLFTVFPLICYASEMKGGV